MIDIFIESCHHATAGAADHRLPRLAEDADNIDADLDARGMITAQLTTEPGRADV